MNISTTPSPLCLRRDLTELGNPRAVAEFVEYQMHAEAGPESLHQYWIASYYDFDKPEHQTLIGARSSRVRVTPVLRVLGTLKRGARLLEVGCGYGRYLARTMNQQRAVGTDIDLEALRMCRRLMLKRFGQCPPLVVADGGCMPFRADTFDYLICTDVLEHIESPQWQRELIEELSRCCNPVEHSRIVVQTPNHYRLGLGLWMWKLWLWITLRSARWIREPFSHGDGGHVGLRNPAELRRLIMSCNIRLRVRQVYGSSWLSRFLPGSFWLGRVLLAVPALRDVFVDRCLFVLDSDGTHSD